MNYLILRFLLFSFEPLVFGRHSSVSIFSCRLRDVIQSTWPIPRGREEVVGWTSRSDRQCVCVCVRFSLISFNVSHRIHPDPQASFKKTSQTNVRRKNFSWKLKPRVSGPFLFLLLLLFFFCGCLCVRELKWLGRPRVTQDAACIILRDDSENNAHTLAPTFSRECLRFSSFSKTCCNFRHEGTKSPSSKR